MTDLQARFRALDAQPAPDLWHEIEARAARSSPLASASPAHPTWLSIAVVIALTVAVTSAVLLGASLWPVPEDPLPSSLPSPSDGPSQTPGPDAGDRPRWIVTERTLQERTVGFTVTLLGDGRVLVASAPRGDRTPIDGAELVAAEVFDPELGSWSPTLSMNQLRLDHTATLLRDGRVLVTGGAYLGRSESSAEIFDPRTGAWTATASMLEARDHHTATLLADGRVLVAGGGARETYHEGERQPTASAELYDPDTGAWSATAPMLAPHMRHSATLLRDGSVLVVPTGREQGWTVPEGIPPGDAEIYDPISGSWSAVPYDPVESHTATLLRDGRVLVVGGECCLKGPGSAHLFDPRTRTWTRAADTIAPRGWHTATLLPDGAVLVAGAGDGGYGGSSAAEVFDPDRGTWTRVPDMIGEHGEHAAVSLADGRVLVVGGYGTNLCCEGEFGRVLPEVYDPGDED